MSRQNKIAFLGGGNMTEALVAGLLKADLAAPDRLWATDVLPERLSHLREEYKIRTSDRNADAARWADILILSVEPQILDGVLHDIARRLGSNTLVISVAAGYPMARVAAHLKKPKLRVVRGMPNTPSSVRAGVAAVCFSRFVTPGERQTARQIFESIGLVVEIDERLMDAVTGLSGSGPAYLYAIIEALADGGVNVGLPRQTAELLATQTLLGTAQLLIESGAHPASLKDRVASPGGTTMAGLQQLEAGRFRAALISAVETATRRSQELG